MSRNNVLASPGHPGEADAPESFEKIEITAEMIAAGVRALALHWTVLRSCEDGAIEEVVGAIIYAAEQERLGYLCRR